MLSFLYEIIQFFINLLPYLLPFLWTCAIIVYSLKFFNSKWDSFTRFGKLEEPSTWSRVPTLSNKIGWIFFYFFSCSMFFASFFVHYPPSIANFLLLFHSFRRFLESIFITRFSNRKMHIINLLAGLLFYCMTPITLAFCSLNKNSNKLYSYLIIIAAIILNYLQFSAHLCLASLKKYSIPRNWLFDKLTSPHYTIEIFLYFVYFLAAPHYLTFMMFIFVILNLTHQSLMTYKWYTNKFGQEFSSLNRYILVPFIF